MNSGEACMFFFSSRRRHTRCSRDWSSDVCSSDLIWKYLKGERARSSEAAHALIELAWSSMAGLAMAPLPDLLNLGKEARMNTPGRAEGNWRWRSTEDMLSDSAFEWLRELTKGTNRSGTPATYGLKKRSEEHTSELQSRLHLVCRLLLEKKKKKKVYQSPKLQHPDRNRQKLYDRPQRHDMHPAQRRNLHTVPVTSSAVRISPTLPRHTTR